MSAASTTSSSTLTGYFYPFPSGTTLGRKDQGVDATAPAGSTLAAIGPARIVGIIPNWYKGQPLIWMEILEGKLKGQFLYYAEQIEPLVHPGQIVKAGQPIARVAPTGTGLELGLATRTGQTLAQATTGYTEGQETNAGKMFSNILGELKGSGSKSTPEFIPGEYSIPLIGGLLKGSTELGETIGGLPQKGTEAIGEKVGEGIIDWLKPIALKLSLYGALIFGAVAMMVYGLTQLLKPVGGPDIAGGIRRGIAGGIRRAVRTSSEAAA